jgi:hypothetical protein
MTSVVVRELKILGSHKQKNKSNKKLSNRIFSSEGLGIGQHNKSNNILIVEDKLVFDAKQKRMMDTFDSFSKSCCQLPTKKTNTYW